MAFTLSWLLHAPETMIRDPELKTEQRPDQEKSAAVDERLSLAAWKWSPAAEKRKQKSQLGMESSGGRKKQRRKNQPGFHLGVETETKSGQENHLTCTRTENKSRLERRKWADPRTEEGKTKWNRPEKSLAENRAKQTANSDLMSQQ
jgi:hypothetical protein